MTHSYFRYPFYLCNHSNYCHLLMKVNVTTELNLKGAPGEIWLQS